MKFNRIGYLIREGFRSIMTHGFMSFASVTIIMACLIIMGSVSLLSLNIDNLIGDLEEQNEIVAFVDEDITDAEEAEKIGDEIKTLNNIQSIEFVSRDSAMDNFMTNYDAELMEGIDESVFRHRFVIHLEDITAMAATKAAIEKTEGIVKVNAHTDYAKAFVSIRNIVTVVSLVLIVILVFVSVFIMTNTIKLATFSRREEIGIMKMVGATNSFIRMPFVVEGIVLGILGGGLAFIAELGIYNFLTGKISTSMSMSYLTLVPFAQFAIPLFLCFIGAGVFVGAFGGVNAIKNYLKV